MEILKKIESDLGVLSPIIKGQDIVVRNCWHFYTDGNDVDYIFKCEEDFRAGMNRIYVLSLRFHIVILAFVLMDTHVHFVLYGDYSECNAFMHEYIRSMSRYISIQYGERKKLEDVTISCQEIDRLNYLKTVISYVIKNPTSAGMPWMPYNYPWSSGSLYFAVQNSWSGPLWTKTLNECRSMNQLSLLDTRRICHTRNRILSDAKIIEDLIFPGEYVAYDIVQRVYRTTKSFHYFMSLNRDEEIEGKGGFISNLSLPLHEMRQHKKEAMMALFGKCSIKELNTSQRVRLAMTLKSKYNSSSKQIARLCCLKYSEVKGFI